MHDSVRLSIARRVRSARVAAPQVASRKDLAWPCGGMLGIRVLHLLCLYTTKGTVRNALLPRSDLLSLPLNASTSPCHRSGPEIGSDGMAPRPMALGRHEMMRQDHDYPPCPVTCIELDWPYGGTLETSELWRRAFRNGFCISRLQV